MHENYGRLPIHCTWYTYEDVWQTRKGIEWDAMDLHLRVYNQFWEELNCRSSKALWANTNLKRHLVLLREKRNNILFNSSFEFMMFSVSIRLYLVPNYAKQRTWNLLKNKVEEYLKHFVTYSQLKLDETISKIKGTVTLTNLLHAAKGIYLEPSVQLQRHRQLCMASHMRLLSFPAWLK